MIKETKDLRNRQQYIDAAEVFAKIAQAHVEHFDLAESSKVWAYLLAFIKDCDDSLDESDSKEERRLIAEQAIAQLFEPGNNLPNNVVALNRHISTLDEQQTKRLKYFARLLFNATERVKSAKDPKSYSKYLIIEGSLTAQFMILLLNSKKSAEDIHEFQKWAQRAAAAGNLFDSLIDFRIDREKGLCDNLPFFSTVFELFVKSSVYGLKSLRGVSANLLYRIILGQFRAIFDR